MAERLAGKVALVTGGSRGIGRSIARRLAADGALVAVHYGSKPEAAAEVVAAIEAAGGKAFAVQAEVGSVPSIRQMFETLDGLLKDRTGAARFDILVNNAGVAPPAQIEAATEDLFDRVYAVNVKGLFFLTQLALPRLNDGGRIINVSSGVARAGMANPDYAVYAPTKGAVDVLTRLLARHLGPRGITVNVLAPGVTDTDMNAGWLGDPAAREGVVRETALGRVGTAEDFAGVAAFLASADAAWVTGQLLEASGGLRL